MVWPSTPPYIHVYRFLDLFVVALSIKQARSALDQPDIEKYDCGQPDGEPDEEASGEREAAQLVALVAVPKPSPSMQVQQKLPGAPASSSGGSTSPASASAAATSAASNKSDAPVAPVVEVAPVTPVPIHLSKDVAKKDEDDNAAPEEELDPPSDDEE